MKKLSVMLLAVLTAGLLVGIWGCAKKAEPPPKAQEQQDKLKEQARQERLEFISSTDKPEGCASCHVNENSLNNVIKKFPEHPQVQANSVAECGACHRKEGYPPLNKIVHRSHYGGEDNIFIKKYNGSCVHCHKKTENGEIFIPGLAAAGTKAVAVDVSQVDKAPEGCLDCHQGNFSLPNMIKKISGHPPVNFEDFNQCYKCHENRGPQLGKVLHNKHLASTTFREKYGNSCLNCHKIMDDGSVVVKGRKA